MKLENYHIESHNEALLAGHQRKLEFITGEIEGSEAIIDKLVAFQIAIPRRQVKLNQ